MYLNKEIIKNIIKNYKGCELEEIDKNYAIITCDIKFKHIDKMLYEAEGSIFNLLDKLSKAKNLEFLDNRTEYDFNGNPFEYVSVEWNEK